MIQVTLHINGTKVSLEADPMMPLLWVIRDIIGLKGTKFGCGMALCGACTIHVDGKAMRSCILPLSSVKEGQKITTIEGLSENADHKIQRAWVEHQVPQCGYCQSGQIMSAAALVDANPNPTDKEIDTAMQGNLCRCGTYQRVRQAIHSAAKNP